MIHILQTGKFALVFTALALTSPLFSSETTAPNPSRYSWKKGIVTTVFWIGQGRTSISATTNFKSAWDADWKTNYGGYDDPDKRTGFVPKTFAATLNPFYVALPFNDVKYPELAKKFVPWYKTPSTKDRWVSQCKGRWIQIRNQNGKVCYGQWEDVGPIRYDHVRYVFGEERPTAFNGAGLDVSPAIQDYLGLQGLDKTDWRFVEDHEVTQGPWLTYGEQAVLFSVIKRQEEELAKNFQPSKISSSKKNDG